MIKFERKTENFEQTLKDMGFNPQRAKKRPIEINVCQINEAFKVETLEGTMEGKPEDYLMQGVQGELYPCSKEVFNKTYEIENKTILEEINGEETTS